MNVSALFRLICIVGNCLQYNTIQVHSVLTLLLDCVSVYLLNLFNLFEIQIMCMSYTVCQYVFVITTAPCVGYRKTYTNSSSATLIHVSVLKYLSTMLHATVAFWKVFFTAPSQQQYVQVRTHLLYVFSFKNINAGAFTSQTTSPVFVDVAADCDTCFFFHKLISITSCCLRCIIQ